MAQVTRTVAQGILDGQGYTDNEVRQLAHHFLAAPQQAVQEPDDITVWKARALQAEAAIEKFMTQPAPSGDAEDDIESAAKALAECMDYPWTHMPEQGRAEMRKHARAVINAARKEGK